MVLKYCIISSLWDRKLKSSLLPSYTSSHRYSTPELYQSAEVAARKQQVADFNKVRLSTLSIIYNKVVFCPLFDPLNFVKANRWRKHGINMMPLRFSLHWDGATPYTVLVSIYAEDGTVAVSHGGVEIGQGINTKVSLSPLSLPPSFILPPHILSVTELLSYRLRR